MANFLNKLSSPITSFRIRPSVLAAISFSTTPGYQSAFAIDGAFVSRQMEGFLPHMNARYTKLEEAF